MIWGYPHFRNPPKQWVPREYLEMFVQLRGAINRCFWAGRKRIASLPYVWFTCWFEEHLLLSNVPRGFGSSNVHLVYGTCMKRGMKRDDSQSTWDVVSKVCWLQHLFGWLATFCHRTKSADGSLCRPTISFALQSRRHTWTSTMGSAKFRLLKSRRSKISTRRLAWNRSTQTTRPSPSRISLPSRIKCKKLMCPGKLLRYSWKRCTNAPNKTAPAVWHWALPSAVLLSRWSLQRQPVEPVADNPFESRLRNAAEGLVAETNLGSSRWIFLAPCHCDRMIL